MIKKIIKSTLSLVLGLLAGLALFSSLRSFPSYATRQQGQVNNDIFGLILNLTEKNVRLREHKDQLRAELESLEEKVLTGENLQQDVKEQIAKYKALLGQRELKGAGVILKIKGDLAVFYFVDLVNEMRNLGADAMIINGKRLKHNSYFSSQKVGDILDSQNFPLSLPSTLKDFFLINPYIYLDNEKISSPYIFKVLGNSAILEEGLNRPGGVLENVRQFSDPPLEISLSSYSEIIIPAREEMELDNSN